MSRAIQRLDRRVSGHRLVPHVGRRLSDAHASDETLVTATGSRRSFLYSALLYGLAYSSHLLFRLGWFSSSDHLDP